MLADAPSWAFLAIELGNVMVADAADAYPICLAFFAHAANSVVLTAVICISAFVAVDLVMLALPSSAALEAVPLYFAMLAERHDGRHWRFQDQRRAAASCALHVDRMLFEMCGGNAI